MKKFYNLFFIVFFQLFFSQNSYHDTKGGIEVNAGGQLQFSLPIELPKGIKNVSPNVSLIYISNSSNGIAGYGWSLSGVTSISRIGKTIEKDGELNGVKLDYSDYFSFNGQKLILKSGVYGQDGAEYVTEKYSNIKIKSIGSYTTGGIPQTWQVSGPTHFEVTFEDGSQAWYGSYTNGFRTENPATTPLEYNIIKWKDAQGNIINYNYEQVNNVAVIKTISWGGNETLNKSNFNEISFNYITRDLKEKSFVNGAPFIQDKLLNDIVVKSNGSQFKKYVIEYFKNGTNYQFANKITEYNSNNEAANPVTFEYPTLTPSSVESVYMSNSDPFNGVKLTGDFNGDSYLDFVMSNGTVKLGAFNDNFTTITTNKYFNSDALVVSTLLDEEGQVYNGNGIIQYESGKLVGYIFRNNTFVKVFEKLVYDQSDCIYQSGGVGCRITAKLNDADIDGDGIANILLSIDRQECEWIIDSGGVLAKNSSKSNNNTSKNIAETTVNAAPPGGTLSCTETHIGDFIVDLKNTTLPIATYTKDVGIDYSNTSNEKFLDVDGDGKIESINVSNTAYTVFEFVKTGTNQYLKKIKFTSNLIETKDPDFPVLFGDFNGDGKLDFTIPVTDTAINKPDNWRFYIGRGNGFDNFLKVEFFTYRKRQTSVNNSYVLFAKQYFYSIADMNKDGKSDVVQIFSYNQINYYNSQYRNYGYVVSSKLANGSLVDGTLDFTPDTSFVSPQESVQDTNDLTLYTPLTNPIKANNNYYNVFVYWKQNLKKIKAPTSLAELSRIKSITQAGLNTSISYTELNPDTNPNFYKKLKKEYYPYFSLQRADQTFAVSQIQQGFRKQDFRYRGMTAHLQGRGMLGFVQSARSSWYADGFENTKVWGGAEIDPQNYSTPIKEWSIKTNDENQIFPTDISVNNTQLASVKITNYTTQQLANGVLTILPQSVTEKDFLKNITSVSTIAYGNYYLPEFTEININNGFARKTSEMHYIHNVGGTGNNYYIGRPDWKEDIVYAYNDTKKAKENYLYSNNLLQSVTKYDNANVGWVKETYTYDEGLQGVGNITKKVSTNSIDSQIITVQDKYEASARFVIKKTDNLGLETNFTYNNWGQVLTQTDTFGNTITNSYDYWGKLLSSSSNLNGLTTYNYNKFSTSNPAIGIMGISGTQVTENSPNGNVNVVFTNTLGQKYKTITKSANQNSYIAKEVAFDGIGRQIGESEPYLTTSISGDNTTVNSSTWSTITYDDSFFPPKVTAQASNYGKKMETSVSGNTVTVKELNGYGRTTSKTTDVLGNVVSSTDAGGTITLTYNALGQNVTATYEGNVVNTSYDVWGRKSQFTDPANGTYTYEYTGFGDIKKEISPKGNKQYNYKPNGLLENIIEVSNDGTSTNKNITLTYNAKWQLTSKSGTSLGNVYQHTYDYYADGRLNNDIENSNNIQFYNSNITYDNYGRIKRYDKGLVSDGVTTSVAIENVYSTWDGSLYQLKQEGTSKILSEIQSVNAKGQILQAKLGATQITNTYDAFGFLSQEKHLSGTNNLMEVSYSFNAIKNELNERHHLNFNIDEYFTYDNNNRLINWTNPRTGQLSNNTYDSKGRITYNDQLGSIGFNMGGNLYRATNLTLNTQGLANFDYNGQSKLLQKITYNENNDPIDIDGTLNDYHFEYGLTDSRQVMSYGGNFFYKAGTPKYIKYLNEDNSSEVVVTYVKQRNGALVKREKHILYIGGNPYTTSIAYIKDFAYPSASFKFLHKDYLGTILAISDEAGNSIEKRHFDAWGNFTHLQKGVGSVITNINAINSSEMLIDRGYTSHEYLAGVELIHMNGRLYDPLLRRFLNADENIQDPYNTQNYNKYGYVMNNPLMYSDPSGEVLFVMFGIIMSATVHSAVLGVIYGVMIAAGSYLVKSLVTGTWSWSGFAKSLLIGAVTGGATGGLLGMYSATTFNGAVVLGSMNGAISSGVEALFNGENFFTGMYRGAVMGGALAGVGYGISVVIKELTSQNSYVFEGETLDVLDVESERIYGTPVEHSSKQVLKIIDEEFNGTMPTNGSILALKNADDLPQYLKNKGYTFDGKILLNENKQEILATTTPFYNNRYMRYVFAPSAARSYEQLTKTTGHELLHGIFDSKGILSFEMYAPGWGITASPYELSNHHAIISIWEEKFINYKGWQNLNLNRIPAININTLVSSNGAQIFQKEKMLKIMLNFFNKSK